MESITEKSDNEAASETSLPVVHEDNKGPENETAAPIIAKDPSITADTQDEARNESEEDEDLFDAEEDDAHSEAAAGVGGGDTKESLQLNDETATAYANGNNGIVDEATPTAESPTKKLCTKESPAVQETPTQEPLTEAAEPSTSSSPSEPLLAIPRKLNSTVKSPESVSKSVVPATPPTPSSHTNSSANTPSRYGLPSDVRIPASVTPAILSGKLLETLKSLPVNLINDALTEYDDAVDIKGGAIRNHGAYLHGVVKRYIDVHKRSLSGEGLGILPMGDVLTPVILIRLEQIVASGFCSQEEMNDKVKSKIRMLAENDALAALDELSSVQRTGIRNFGSYFMGILNRYMRGEASKSMNARKQQTFKPDRPDRDGDRNNRFYRDTPSSSSYSNNNNNSTRDRSRDRFDDQHNRSSYQAPPPSQYDNRYQPHQQEQQQQQPWMQSQQQPRPTQPSWQQPPNNSGPAAWDQTNAYGPPQPPMSNNAYGPPPPQQQSTYGMPPNNTFAPPTQHQQPYGTQQQQQQPPYGQPPPYGNTQDKNYFAQPPSATHVQPHLQQQQQTPYQPYGNQQQQPLPVAPPFQPQYQQQPSFGGNQPHQQQSYGQAPSSFGGMQQQHPFGGNSLQPVDTSQQQPGSYNSNNPSWLQPPSQQPYQLPVDIFNLADKAASAVQALNAGKSFGATAMMPPQQAMPYIPPGPTPFQTPFDAQPPQPNSNTGGPSQRRRTTATLADLPVMVQYAVQVCLLFALVVVFTCVSL
jgi:hypothetical protein